MERHPLSHNTHTHFTPGDELSQQKWNKWALPVPHQQLKCLFAICSHCTWSERGRAAKSFRGTLSASYRCCLRISVWSDFIKVAPPAFVSLNVLLPKVINTDGYCGLSCKEQQQKPCTIKVHLLNRETIKGVYFQVLLNGNEESVRWAILERQ